MTTGRRRIGTGQRHDEVSDRLRNGSGEESRMPRIVTKTKHLIGGAIPPLDDPTYAPVHQPINGRVPDVVARWGPNSQLRWFRRFRNQLAGRQDWEQFYCETDRHRGTCCTSCWDEYQDGYGVILDGWCCCRAIRERDKAA